MKLVAQLDENAFNSLPESVNPKELFVKNEKDNVYVLALGSDDAGKLAVNLQQEVARLKSHNETVLGEKDKLQAAIKSFQDLGKTPQEIADILKNNSSEDIIKLSQTHKTEMESLQNSIANERQTWDVEKATLKSKVQTALKGSAISLATKETNATPLAVDFLANRTAVIELDNGDFAVRVLDEKGEIDYKAGQPKSIVQLLEEKKTDPNYAGMFFAGQAGGGGINPTNQGQGIKNGYVNINDTIAVGDNLEKIASGEVKVTGVGE